MADEKFLQVLKQGATKWNKWRQNRIVLRADPYISPFRLDLSGARLRGTAPYKVALSGVDLHDADLSRAELSEVDLSRADLSDANLSDAHLSNVNLSRVDLSGTDLSGARFSRVTFIRANLSEVRLSDTWFDHCTLGSTLLNNLDLRQAKGLRSVEHLGPSNVSIGTIYKSEGDIPETFLHGCGIPESFIAQIPALVAAMQPIQFYSCFISYSGKDEEFSRRLHSRMRQAELRVWFAPENMKGGDKLYDQIDRAIQIHDRLLLVLSENSLRSKWVELEIRRARKVELRESRRKLFPIRLVSYEALQEWTCIDSTTGEDLAEEVRSYFIPDFSNWKSHDDFERAFARLLADLKASV